VYTTSKECPKEAELYAKPIESYAKPTFLEGQMMHCKCVPNGKAVESWIGTIGKFYKTHAPEKMKDFFLAEHENFIKNTGTDERHAYDNMVKFFYDLHKEYDEKVFIYI
jgi:hypothetical protein